MQNLVLKLNGRRSKHSIREGSILTSGDSWKKKGNFRELTRDSAATRIQTAFRAYKVRVRILFTEMEIFMVESGFCVGEEGTAWPKRR